MVFSSTVFLFLFLPVVLSTYFVLPRRLRNVWLLFASLFFYAWGEPRFVLILCGSIGVNFACALLIANGTHGEIEVLPENGPRTRLQRSGLVVAIATNLALLAFFKYAGFGASSFERIGNVIGIAPAFPLSEAVRVALPLGISFFTFQAMSYVIDVYRGHVRATRNLVHFAAYVSMFPQLVAGPIVRYADIASSLLRRDSDPGLVASGVRRFTVGLAKKVLIADAFATTADAVFALPPGELTAGIAWLGVFAYTLQIYFDFSGYSDMAIGLGRILGFRFHENFNYPYIAQSITEFWRRWHISLSTWFRDYLYIPLGGNRQGAARTMFNLSLVFLLCGLWHGASWNFVAWGAYHGAFLSIERFARYKRLPITRAPAAMRHAYTLLVVMGGWVMFRAENLHHAAGMYAAMAGFGQGGGAYYPGLYITPYTALLAVVSVLLCAPIAPNLAIAARRWVPRPAFLHAIATAFAFCLFALSIMEIAATTHRPFIYFRF